MFFRLLSHALILVALPALTLARQEVVWSIGNSLSSYGGTIVGSFRCFYQGYRSQFGITRVDTPRSTPGGATFGLHWAWLLYDDNTPTFMNENGNIHTWVFLQEQSAIPAVPAQLPVSIFNLRGLIHHFKSTDVERAMLIQTWGYEFGTSSNGVNFPDMPSHNQALLAGYVEMQKAVHSDDYQVGLAPCGLAWEKTYWNCLSRGMDPMTDEDCVFRKLYQDPVHPSAFGTYLCSLTVFSTITGIHPSTQGCKGDLSTDEADQIHLGIAQAIEETYSNGLITYLFDSLWDTPEPTPAPPTTPPTGTPTVTRYPTGPPQTEPPTASPTTGAPTVLNANAVAAADTSKILILGNEVLGNYNVSQQFEYIHENSLALHNVKGHVVATSSTPEGATFQWHINTIAESDPVLYSSADGHDFDWIVLQEDIALMSALGSSESCNLSPAFHTMVASTHDSGVTVFVMTPGGRNGWEDKVSGESHEEFMTHNAILFENYYNCQFTYPDESYLLPVTQAYEEIYLEDWESGEDPALDETSLFFRLYNEDGINPSAEGSYLIAVLLSTLIGGLDPARITWIPDGIASGLEFEIAAQDAVRLRAVASKVYRWADRPWQDAWPTTSPTDAPTPTPAPVITLAPVPAATEPPVPATEAPVEETPGNGPPEETPGNGPPEETPGNGPPEETPGNGPPEETPANEEVPECTLLPPPTDDSCAAINPSTIDDGIRGVNGRYNGWYSLNDDGCCHDYCRWVGTGGTGPEPTIQTTHGNSFFACRPAGYSTCTYWTEYATPFTAEKCLAQGVPQGLVASKSGEP
ncbi:expressed unknown protein [Seminavis robusta]|uniref:Uncharacterized protein n=1 Tax=Seminavis robusta TaxID=568900 RepID=A0A9N8DK27_9STRA|nr:expressed unknown protein [Seminavis robusta]|eukprot:Sro129_g061460.1 n/a (805) ;mRNA; r:21123-23622